MGTGCNWMVNAAISGALLRPGHALEHKLTLCDCLLYFVCTPCEQSATFFDLLLRLLRLGAQDRTPLCLASF